MTDPVPSDSVVTWTTEGPAFVVRLANPPANQLGQSLLDGLSAALGAFEASAARILVVRSGLDGFFAAGADIKLMAGADRATLRALDMMLTAREVPAEEALAIGLLDRVTEPGGALEQALELAGQFGAMSRPALAAVLRCVDDAAELPLAEGMAREADRVTDLLDSPDGQEGLAAFIAKRPASFA